VPANRQELEHYSETAFRRDSQRAGPPMEARTMAASLEAALPREVVVCVRTGK